MFTTKIRTERLSQINYELLENHNTRTETVFSQIPLVEHIVVTFFERR